VLHRRGLFGHAIVIDAGKEKIANGPMELVLIGLCSCTAVDVVIVRAHTHGVKVGGCTILPYVGSGFYPPGPLEEADRQAVNQWIRTSGEFDEVIDFDEATRDPASPDRLLPKFDSGDHLHPSPAGYAAMANAVPLTFFTSTEPTPPVREQKPNSAAAPR
jgi:hypothetical protein